MWSVRLEKHLVDAPMTEALLDGGWKVTHASDRVECLAGWVNNICAEKVCTLLLKLRLSGLRSESKRQVMKRVPV